MSNAFVKIKMCYVYNQWYDISCATLYNRRTFENEKGPVNVNGLGQERWITQ